MLKEHCTPGAVVHVAGRHEVHPRWGAQLAVRAVRPPAEGSFAWSDLLDGPPVPAERMERDLHDLVATVQDPHLRALLDAILGPGTPTWEHYRRAPAAKVFHQAYAHGLLEHSLTVAQGVSALAATFPGIDRDVAVTGALLHDIGKLEAYTADPRAIDLTDQGKLLGEIPLGYYRVRQAIEALPGFPPETAQAVLHIILSHHGALEHGSPGGAVHARGHARALHRQPRRPPGQLRPPREGARPGRRVVVLRPRARRRRLLRPRPGAGGPAGRRRGRGLAGPDLRPVALGLRGQGVEQQVHPLERLAVRLDAVLGRQRGGVRGSRSASARRRPTRGCAAAARSRPRGPPA